MSVRVPADDGRLPPASRHAPDPDRSSATWPYRGSGIFEYTLAELLYAEACRRAGIRTQGGSPDRIGNPPV
ncbi:MAG TPA: hypothetical protein VHG51_19345 [Longimicrobiaceae bacterium]|nr:hypothetical protein [Longimicrobiaceae bacterium]